MTSTMNESTLENAEALRSVHITLPPPTALERLGKSISSHSQSTTSGGPDLKDVSFERESTSTSSSLSIEKDAHLQKLEMLPPLTSKRSYPKRSFSRPLFSPHRRLMTILILSNVVLLIASIFKPLNWHDSPITLSLIFSINLTLTVIIRQQRLVNIFFKFSTISRTNLPLSVRWALAKIYHFGGIHSGAAISATMWLIAFSVSLTRHLVDAAKPTPSIALLVVTYVLDALLIVIVIFALPQMRQKYHNTYELTHRFLGWTALALFWPQSILLARDFVPEDTQSSLAVTYFTSPAPYLLFLVTMSIISPWVTVRKHPITVVKPSSHAIMVSFPSSNLYPPFAGSSSSVSLTPLQEYHSFANIPNPTDGTTRVIISRAGDWTSKVIDNPPTHLYVRGIPTAGVANIETLFKSVLYICTGSGIGPVLPHLLARHVPASLFWSARSPVDTYGQAFVDEVANSVEREVEVWDTAVSGKPDMVAWAWGMKQLCNAEAVIVISNQKLTRKIVYGMEARGVPTFGAIWDS